MRGLPGRPHPRAAQAEAEEEDETGARQHLQPPLWHPTLPEPMRGGGLPPRLLHRPPLLPRAGPAPGQHPRNCPRRSRPQPWSGPGACTSTHVHTRALLHPPPPLLPAHAPAGVPDSPQGQQGVPCQGRRQDGAEDHCQGRWCHDLLTSSTGGQALNKCRGVTPTPRARTAGSSPSPPPRCRS